MKKIKTLVAVAVFGLVTLLSPGAVMAKSVFDKGCEARPNSPVCQQTARPNEAFNGFTQNIVSTLLVILGIIAVIVIIIGGIKYATSDGDSGKIASAKNTILYAVIGLIVAMLAYSIVNFVVERF